MGFRNSRGGRGVAALPLLCVLVAPLIASCSAPSDTPEPWSDQSFPELIAVAIDEATSAGASDQQIALLTSAQQEGQVPIDIAKTAAFNVVDCFNSVGGQAEYEEKTTPSGLVQPGYKVIFDETLPDAVYESCVVQEYRWVNRVHQMQPSSRELVGQYVTSKEDVLRECLEGAGIATDPEATGWDLAQQAVQLPVETAGFDCLVVANIDSL